MPDICTDTTTINPLKASESCKTKILITNLCWTRSSFIDLENIPVDANGCSTSFPMLGGELWQDIGLDALKADWTFSFNADEGYYDNSLAIDLSGFDKEKRVAICNALNYCDLAFYVITNDCKQRIGGFENFNGNYQRTFKSKIGNHEGAIGNANEASNLVTFTWQSYCEPEFTEVTLDTLPKA